MSFAIVAATVLFSLSDPRGDALGDGAYALPQQVEQTVLDLRTFTALNVNGKLELKLTMDSIDNATRAPNGFSGPAFEVFLANSKGGQQNLIPTGFQAQLSHGWQYRISVNGYTSRLISSNGKPVVSLVKKVHVEGSDVVIATGLPAQQQYAYWVFVGVYDPLTREGLKIPTEQWTSTSLASAIPGAPSVVDVLSNTSQVGLYASRVVPALNEPVVTTSPLLLTGLVGLCLMLGASIWSIVRRG